MALWLEPGGGLLLVAAGGDGECGGTGKDHSSHSHQYTTLRTALPSSSSISPFVMNTGWHGIGGGDTGMEGRRGQGGNSIG